MNNQRLEKRESKRRSRAEVLFDYEDYLIVSLCRLEDKVPLSLVKEYTGLSHNSLLIHTKRLRNYGLIKIERGKDEDYKSKYVIITRDGKRAYDIYRKNINTKEKVEAHMEELKKVSKKGKIMSKKGKKRKKPVKIL